MAEAALTRRIIGGAIEVHRALGPGLLESAYRSCLAHELVTRGLRVQCERPLRVTYKEVQLDCAYRLDLLVEGCVIVEVKAVAGIEPVHEAQIISYLKLSGCRIGLLINFNSRQLIRGIRRFVNDPPGQPHALDPATTE